MTRPWHPRNKRLLLVLAFLLMPAALRPFTGDAQERPALTDLLVGSTLVIQGQVAEVLPHGQGGIHIAGIRIIDTIKGNPPDGGLRVAEELKFPSDPPSFHKGKGAILFLAPLPDYSKWAPFRAKGVHYTPAGGSDGVWEMETGPLAETSEFLKSYTELAAARDKEGKRRYVNFLMKGFDSALPQIQTACASAMARLNPLDALLGKKERDRLVRFLENRTNSLDARRRLVRALSGLEGFDAVIAGLAVKEPGIRLDALEALASNEGGRAIRMDVIHACLEDSDPDVRLSALDLLIVSPGADADNALGAIALSDSSVEVRARAISALGKREGDMVKEIAPLALEDPSPFVVFVASDEIRKMGGKEAAETLGALIEKDDPTIRFIGIIMLGALADEEAHSILENASRAHPDPKTRDMALKILSGDAVDMDAVRRDLGVDEVLDRYSVSDQ